MGREFDIVVYGATGFSGTLICQYLAKHGSEFVAQSGRGRKGDQFSWAVGGRNKNKLEQLVKTLEQQGKQQQSEGNQKASFVLPSTNVVVADCAAVPNAKPTSADLCDRLAREVTSKCHVLLNCAGPFLQTGEVVVQACLQTKTHYVDITGEPQFFNRVAQKYNDVALQSGVWLVPAAGFDCFPSELGFFEAARKSASHVGGSDEDEGGKGVVVDCFVTVENQGFSTGTLRTLINSIATQQQKKTKTTKTERTASFGGFKKLPQRPHYSSLEQKWVMPLPSADPCVIRRQFQFLADYGDGRGGTQRSAVEGYRHWATTSSLYSFVKGLIVIVILTILVKYVPFGRRALTALIELINGKNGGPAQLKSGRCRERFFVSTPTTSRLACTVTTDHIYSVTASAATCATLSVLLVSSSPAAASQQRSGGVVSLVSYLVANGMFDCVKGFMEKQGGVVLHVAESTFAGKGSKL